MALRLGERGKRRLAVAGLAQTGVGLLLLLAPTWLGPRRIIEAQLSPAEPYDGGFVNEFSEIRWHPVEKWFIIVPLDLTVGDTALMRVALSVWREGEDADGKKWARLAHVEGEPTKVSVEGPFTWHSPQSQDATLPTSGFCEFTWSFTVVDKGVRPLIVRLPAAKSRERRISLNDTDMSPTNPMIVELRIADSWWSLLQKIGGVFSVVLGPMVTIPWWLDRRKNKAAGG